MECVTSLLIIFAFLSSLDCISSQSSKDYSELETRVQILEHMVNNQQDIIERQALQHKLQQQELVIGMKREFRELVEQYVHGSATAFVPQFETGSAFKHQTPVVLNVRSSFACMGNETYMACPDDTKIFVSHAHYGKYIQACTSQCCLPNPLDCIEIVSENDEAEWLALKYACDNQTTCSYLFRGAVFIDEECGTGEDVQYLNVFYSCLPGDDTGPIAFSAHASQNRDYNTNDLVIFDEIVTNINGAYQKNNSIFICPVNGIYAFSVNILSVSGEAMKGVLYKEGVGKGGFQSERVEGVRQAASHFVIVECSAWERIWVKASADGCNMYGSYNYSTFSGFLIYRF